MNILVINGSPKGNYSCTLQSVLFLEKHFPEHSFVYLHAGAQINCLARDFSEAAAKLREAELLLFAYPVYTFLAPSQLHRFIALMKANHVDVAGKYAAQLTTSKHFYDVTAHRYIEENCQDLGLKVIRGLSADMDDLLTTKGQNDVLSFLRYTQWCVSHDFYAPFPAPAPAPAHRAVHVPQAQPTEKPGDIVIVADISAADRQLSAMIERFRAVMPRKTRLVNLHDFPFRGGCLSCFGCAARGDCIYTDGFQELLRSDIQQAEAIVIAFTIQDHSMGTIFKTYDDRQFCNGHRTVTMGKPFGYLVSGSLRQEENLRTVIEARAQVGGNFLAGVADDDCQPDAEIDRLAQTLCYAAEQQYTPPANFLGVGGMKIFRDLIWLMQGMMRADHRFYKAHGQYDFPQKKRGTMLKMYLAGALIANPKIKQKMGSKLNEGMLAPYKKVLEKAQGKEKQV